MGNRAMTDKPLRVIVCGTRFLLDRIGAEGLRKRLSELKGQWIVIEGGASGVDSQARELAMQLGFMNETHSADWKCFGKLAGPIRNQKMLNMGVDLVLALALTYLTHQPSREYHDPAN